METIVSVLFVNKVYFWLSVNEIDVCRFLSLIFNLLWNSLRRLMYLVLNCAVTVTGSECVLPI